MKDDLQGELLKVLMHSLYKKSEKHVEKPDSFSPRVSFQGAYEQAPVPIRC